MRRHAGVWFELSSYDNTRRWERLHTPAVGFIASAATLLMLLMGQNDPAASTRQWELFNLDPGKIDFELHGQANSKLQSLRAVRSRLQDSHSDWLLATNAGIFHPGFRPVGLHVERGAQWHALETADGRGNFYLKPNGVFYLRNNEASVVATTDFKHHDDIQLAIQSGPLLVQHGQLHPRLNPGSSHGYTRSAIGVRKDGNVIIALSKQPITLYQAALAMRDQFGCVDALYLDGGISDFTTPEKRPAQNRRYGGVLVAIRRAP